MVVDPSIVNLPALTVLRLVVWANAGFALTMLLAVGLWLISCWFDHQRTTE